MLSSFRISRTNLCPSPAFHAWLANTRCKVQVPVEHLGQAVALEALVTPTPRSQRGHENPFPASHNASASGGGGGGVGSSSDYNSGASGSGQGGGGGSGKGGGGDFANRLDGLFALSRWVVVRRGLPC